jgi:molecular chaperone DnaK
MAGDNRLLGQFNLEGIPPAPRGLPQIDVTFDIDVNGILNVSAKDRATNKETKVKIEQSSGISKEEIEKMRKDADSHADEDKKKRELAEARNHAERLVYECEKLMKEHADKLDAGSKSAIETAVARVKEAEKSNDVAAIKSAVEALEQATHALSKHMYETSQASAGGTAGAGAGGPTAGAAAPADDNVIDAEFEKK